MKIYEQSSETSNRGLKIAFISDTHFGYARATERENDCWETVEEALRRIAELKCDLIVHAGDMFDIQLPRPEDWSRALKLFSSSHVPLIAIHGNHERRGRGLTNPAAGLARGNHFDYVDAQTRTFEVNGRRVAVHGLGWVPEMYARSVLEQWKPKPVADAFNIIVLHQSIHPFIYSPLEPPSLKLEELPEGFDLYVDGHIHQFIRSETHGKPFIVVGSTVTTQVNKSESETPKGFVVVDFDGTSAKIENIPLESARRVYYKEIEVDGHAPSEVRELVESFLRECLAHEHRKKPLIRVRIVGKMDKGTNASDIDLKGLRESYGDRALVTIGSSLRDEATSVRVSHNLREQRLSVDELGFSMLREALKKNGSAFAFEEVFERLADGDVDGALAIMLAEEPVAKEVTTP